MLAVVFLCFSIGVAVKLGDMVADDGIRLGRYASWVIGVAYGSMLSFLMWAYPILSPLVVAVVLGVVFTHKIDHEVHYFGLGSAVLLSSVLGIGPVDPFLLAVFILGGVIDETGHDISERKKHAGPIPAFFRQRLTMEVLTLVVSILTGEWLFFIAMLCADAGYTYLFSGLHAARLIRVRRQ